VPARAVHKSEVIRNEEQSITLTAMVISVCTIIINPKIQKIEVSEDILAPKIVKNMVSFIFFRKIAQFYIIY